MKFSSSKNINQKTKKSYKVRFYFSSGRIFFSSGALLRLGIKTGEYLSIHFLKETSEWYFKKGTKEEDDFNVHENYKNRPGGTIYCKYITSHMLDYIKNKLNSDVSSKDSAIFLIGEKDLENRCMLITNSYKSSN